MPDSSGRELRGRKGISRYMGVSIREVPRLRLRGAPIVIDEGGMATAITTELDEWIRSRDREYCPRFRAICPFGRPAEEKGKP